MKKWLLPGLIATVLLGFNCGGTQVREDIPIQIPEDIDSSEAKNIVSEAQKDFDTLKNDKVNETSPEEYMKAEEYLKTARKFLNEEEEKQAYFAAGKARAYIALARITSIKKAADKKAKETAAELK